MASSTPERDWKFMRRIEKDLLARLCAGINKRSVEILQDNSIGEHEKYLAHYDLPDPIDLAGPDNVRVEEPVDVLGNPVTTE